MKFFQASNLYSLNKNTYVNLRWIAYFGQFITILFVNFILEFSFNYIYCILILFISIILNFHLQFKVKTSQLKNNISTIYLVYDIIQLALLFYLTGGITNPFIFLLIVPAVLCSQYLHFVSSIILVTIIILILIILTFFYQRLPHSGELHFHAPDYYLYSIPFSIIIGLFFLVYFSFKFGEESRIRKKAYDKIQEIMAKENELLSLGGQAAAAAHSLGTPLSTILLTAQELKKEFGTKSNIQKDLDLLVSQSIRCRDILQKLSLNPRVEDGFIEFSFSLKEYITEIVRSYKEISNKKFYTNFEGYKNSIKIHKSTEIIYGLRNFIGNANKFSNEKININLISNKEITKLIIKDDGPGFPKDLVDRNKLGEPYIRTTDQNNISKYGLGLGTFIGKTLLEKNYAIIEFNNLKDITGAEVSILWNNKDLKKIS